MNSIAVPTSMPRATATGRGAKATLTMVLLGRDAKGRPHAAAFGGNDEDRAVVAAAQMGLAAVKLRSKEASAIANKLPRGKLFKSGSALVPFVGRPAFDQLVATLPKDEQTKIAAQAPLAGAGLTAPPIPPKDRISAPPDWSKIVFGSLVLAQESLDDGWFEAIVVEVKGDDLFMLRWRDYPDAEPIARKRHTLALLYDGVFGRK